ncbi:MAG: NAD-dependent epimerase/dehydratase family protein, partial [Devosia sp.]|nr:NAD-dependent epimerase/dehydratase family protein [Devosia sp.]
MKVFVTGTAGFIGFHLARRLLADGHSVTGYDGMTPFYDEGLKAGRMALLSIQAGFHGVQGMLEDAAGLTEALGASQAEIVVHLAAQAGVRYSIEAPQTYISSNLVGTANLLEAVRAHRPQHLVFASTSSIYGGNLEMPFAETDRADNPVSLYAATKKGGEAMVHAYAHLWGIPAT